MSESTKTCYVLRHVSFESLGLLEPLIVQRGFSIRLLDVPVTTLPTASILESELVVVLGGPISVYDEKDYAFLTDELKILEGRFRENRATLGVCLGAQLMAKALGAKVYPGRAKEIGWSKLQLTQQGMASALSAIDQQNVLHWHGDTFDLPAGAQLLASTDVTPHQAFAWQNTAMALQFHLEVIAEELEAWYVGHAVELSKIGIPELRAAGRTHAPALATHAKRAIRAMLDSLLGAHAS